MSPSSVGAHIPQSRDIVPHLPPQFVLNPHGREFGVEVEDLLCVQLAQLAARMDVETGHNPLGYVGPDAVEELERSL